jgi:hypothetical protein
VLQFVPGDFELALGALMLKTIKPHVFHQNVQAVNESTSRGIPVLASGCGGSRNTRLPEARSKLRLIHEVSRCMLRR